MTQGSARQTVFADIASRAAALLVDLVLLVIAAAAVAAELPGPYVFPALAFLYFGVEKWGRSQFCNPGCAL